MILRSEVNLPPEKASKNYIFQKVMLNGKFKSNMKLFFVAKQEDF